MTFVVVVMVGLGAVLLISGIEDSPFLQTFSNVIRGIPPGAVDTQTPASISTAPTTTPAAPGTNVGGPNGPTFVS